MKHVVESRVGAMVISRDSLYRLCNPQAPRPAFHSQHALEQFDSASSGVILEMLFLKN